MRWRSTIRFAAWGAVVVCAYIATVKLLVRPAHAAGNVQLPASFFNGASALLEAPGRLALVAAADLTGARPRGWPARAAVFASHALVYLLGFAAAHAALVLARGRLGPTDERDNRPPPSPARRDFLALPGKLAFTAAAATGAYAFFAEPRRITISRIRVPVRDLPPALAGLRIAHLTDLHLGPWTTREFIDRVVDVTNLLSPDVVALTGDYISDSPTYIAPVVEALARLKANVGVVGVLGNHDWKEGGVAVRDAFRAAGIPLVDNSRLFVTPRGALVAAAKDGLCLAGVGDLWTDRQLYDQALGNLPGHMPRILLSHNPDVAEEPDFLNANFRTDLILAGHTHGGQIRLPGIGAPITMSRHGQKYVRGLVQSPRCPIYISRGIGTTSLPLRFHCPPEVAVIELAPAARSTVA